VTYTARRGTIEVEDRASWMRAKLASSLLLRGATMAGGPIVRHVPGARHDMEQWWARRVRRALRVDLAIEGADNIQPDEQYIVVANHEGMFDPVALLHLPLHLRFAVRSEIFDWHDVGAYLDASNQVAVDPEQGMTGFRRLIVESRRSFGRGESLAIFAQGTLLGIETAFQAGAFRLATMTGRPVLPVVITGSHRVWEHPFQPTLRLDQKVGVRVLPPVPPVGPAAELRDRVQERVKAAALDGSMPLPRRYDPDRDGLWNQYHFDIDPAFAAVAARVATARLELAQVPRGVSPKTARRPSPPNA